MKKKLDKLQANHKELQNDYADENLELRSNTLELEKTQRALQDLQAAATAAHKLKQEMDHEYKELTELRKEKEKDIQQLNQKNAELQLQLDRIQHDKVERAKKQALDKQEVETERNSLKSQQRHFENQLEAEKRALQTQFNDMKRELQTDFRLEVEQLRTRCESQISEVTRAHRAQLATIRTDAEKKLSVLEHEKHDLDAKAQQITRGIQEREATIARLQTNLRRESMNADIQGISKIDWLKEQAVSGAELRDRKGKEKKIEQFRKKILDATNELATVKRQHTHAEDHVNRLKVDLDDKDVEFHRLESERDELERRLNSQIDELVGLVSKRDDSAQAEFEATKKKLEADIEAQEILAKALQQEIDELTSEQKQTKQFASKLVEKVGSKLAADGGSDIASLSALEKAKRESGSDARKARKDLAEARDHVATLEKEAEKVKKQYAELLKGNERLQVKNQKLEAAIRRVDTRF